MAETAPIESVVEGFGAFPRASDARVIWAGVRERLEPASGLHALYLRVHGALDGLGLALEPAQARSTWQAHVTLARRQRAQRARLDAREPIAELERAWRAVDWRVDSLCLFESDRARARGSRYPVLARIPLNG